MKISFNTPIHNVKNNINKKVSFGKELGVDGESINNTKKEENPISKYDEKIGKTFEKGFINGYNVGFSEGFVEGYNKSREDTIELNKPPITNIIQ